MKKSRKIQDAAPVEPDQLGRKQSLEAVGTVIQGLLALAYYSYQSKTSTWTKVRTLQPLLQRAGKHLLEAGIPSYDYEEVVNEFVEFHVIEDSRNALDSLFLRVIDWRNELVKDTKMSPMLIKLLENARLMAQGSSSAFRYVKDNVGIFKNRDLTELFISGEKPDKAVQDASLKRLQELVGYLGGKGNDLSPDERKAAKESKPNMYQDFLDLRREIVYEAKSYMQDWVRTNSDDNGLADYQQLLGVLNTNFALHNFPSGFTGKIDDLGRPHTNTGKLITGFPVGGVVMMNPQYNEDKDDAYVFKSRAPNAVVDTWHYTTDYKKKAVMKKFEKVKALSVDVKDLRKKWRKKLRGDLSDPSDEQQIAIIIELTYQTQIRIGGERNKSKVDGVYRKTFGLSTLEMRHIQFRGNKMFIRYEGKKAQKQRHVLQPSDGNTVKRIIEAMKQWKAESSSRDRVFWSEKDKPISGHMVNTFLRKIGIPEDVTGHKFRHLKGMEMMEAIIDRHPFKDKPATTLQVQRWLRKEAEAIGAQLGHFSGEKVTGNTALNNYVSPASMLRLFREAQAAPHPSLLTIMGIDAKAVDFDLDFLETATIKTVPATRFQ